MFDMQTPTPAGAGGVGKVPTGIRGLDEITFGGLPKGRPTLVCGGPGCGKTLLAAEFLVRGAVQFDEPGVFIAFEETAADLTKNVRSLGFDLDQLVAEGKLLIDYVYLEPSEIEETGEYDLEGLFIRLGHAIDAIGARRVAIDTLEVLFTGLPSPGTVRSELRRLFRWLKEREITAVITAERGETSLTRHGLEEYVADCVLTLDHQVDERRATRYLQIVKYRGSAHQTDRYPFLIGNTGLSVLPITPSGPERAASDERIPSGVPGLDRMLGGQGFFRGSRILVSGTAGTAKTSLATVFAQAACQRGERCLFVSYEESRARIVRNMRSIGVDLEPWLASGLLELHESQGTAFGLEQHLVTLLDLVHRTQPRIVIVDSLTSLLTAGSLDDTRSMIDRLIDLIADGDRTVLLTSLTPGDVSTGDSEIGISSSIDAWVLLRNVEANGERNRGLYVVKARGMGHSNQVAELVLSERGLEIVDVCVDNGEVLLGSARRAYEARRRLEALARDQERERGRRALTRKQHAVEAQIAALRADLATDFAELRDSDELSNRYRAAQVAGALQAVRSRMGSGQAGPESNGADGG